MTDRCLTDSEIFERVLNRIKKLSRAYQDWISTGGDRDKVYEEDLDYMLQLVDLVEKQKAEIERLETAFENSQTATKHWHRTAELNAQKIMELQAEIERLKEEAKGFDKFIAETDCSMKEIQSEAVKEFAEKLLEERLAVILLKGKNDDYSEGYEDALDYVEKQVNNLVKETVGE